MGTPPLPAGYALDQSAPPLPTGYKLDEAAPPQPRTFGDSFGDFAREWWNKVNPVTAVKGIAQTVTHPVQAYEADKSARDKLVDLTRQSLENASKEDNPLKKANHYLNAFTYALQSDLPVVGPALQAPAEKFEQGNIAGGLGETAGLATQLAAPKLASNMKLKLLPTGAGTAAAENLYQSALKPPPGSYSSAQVSSMVKTALEHEIPVSASGVEKLSDLVSDLNSKINAKIQAGSNKGVTVSSQAVASRLADTSKRFATQVNPNADLQQIYASGKEFLENQPADIPAAQAQALKVGTYQQLGNKAYGELSSATQEAQKALARGIKEELQKQFPEIGNLNAQEGRLIGLDEALQRAVRRIDNHDIISLGSTVAAGAGAAAAGTPGAIAGFVLKKTLQNPMVRSRLAFALNKGARGSLSVSGTNAKIASYLDALGNALPATSQDSAGQSIQGNP